MKILILPPLLLGFSVPAIAHNEANGFDAMHSGKGLTKLKTFGQEVAPISEDHGGVDNAGNEMDPDKSIYSSGFSGVDENRRKGDSCKDCVY